jgi:hypothetical protein
MKNNLISREAICEPDSVHRTQVRPLDLLSNYVIEELPTDLQKIRNRELSIDSFQKKVDETATAAMDLLKDLSPTDAQIGRLDVMILQQALQTSGASPQEGVHVLADTLSAKRPLSMPSLSYEDLILSNPKDDPRTFNRGDIGRSEIFFYEVHQEIEKTLYSMRCELDRVLHSSAHLLAASQIDAGISVDRHDYEKLFDEHLIPGLSSIESNMENMKEQLKVQHFNAMRGSFVPNLYRGISGPSGKFSAGFYAMDALLLGRVPEMAEFNSSKRREQFLFPVGPADDNGFLYANQETMRSVDFHVMRRYFPTLLDIRFHGLSSPTRAVLKKMHDVRKMHFQLFAQFVGAGSGTGGAREAADFLKIPLRIYADAVQASA